MKYGRFQNTGNYSLQDDGLDIRDRYVWFTLGGLLRVNPAFKNKLSTDEIKDYRIRFMTDQYS